MLAFCQMNSAGYAMEVTDQIITVLMYVPL